MAEQHQIRFTRGDSWSGLRVTWNDSEGDPVSIASARMQIREKSSSTTFQLELTDEDGIDVDGGTVTPAITPEQSQDLSNGVYDLEATSATGTVRTLVYGDFIVDKDISRDD